jgi:hypothetical protein
MEEIICPKCKRIQKVNKNNLCSYCFYDFKRIENIELNKKEAFPIDYNNLKDEQIVDYLKIDKIKSNPSKLFSIIFFITILSISGFIFFIEQNIFPFSQPFGFIEKFAIFISVITSFYFYRYLGKKYNLDILIDEVIPDKNKMGKEASFYEKKFYFIFLLFLLNTFTIFLNIYALNDITSIIVPQQKFDVFVISKNTTRVKSGYNYYITVTNWKRNQDSEITLKVNNKDIWEKIQSNLKAEVKIKRGLLSEVIWSFKQE